MREITTIPPQPKPACNSCLGTEEPMALFRFEVTCTLNGESFPFREVTSGPLRLAICRACLRAGLDTVAR